MSDIPPFELGSVAKVYVKKETIIVIIYNLLYNIK